MLPRRCSVRAATPRTCLPPSWVRQDLDENGSIQVADLLVKTELAPSKAEAKRLIKQGGISVNDEKVTAFDAALTKEDFAKGEIIVKKGKKVFHKVTLA